MIPIGYMAKRVSLRPDWLHAPGVEDIYSVSHCVSDDFTEVCIHEDLNSYWFFDSPSIIWKIAKAYSIDMKGTKLFYYEMYELEFDHDENDQEWLAISVTTERSSCVVEPDEKHLEGYDLATYYAGEYPECSPLSCNHMAQEIPTNRHCLLATFAEAKQYLEKGFFVDCEPGIYRIIAVYSV
ncbi:hypothetical protein ACFL2Q_02525 [Thermodesulfobacteriota bacterium]